MRHHVLAAIALLCWGTGAAFAGTESELRAIEESRRAAIKAQDFAVLEKIYGPTFAAVGGNGQVIDRATLFDMFRHNDPSLSFATDEIRIVSDGDTAVFFGRLTGRTSDGKVAFRSRFSHVFVRRAGAWLCIAGQSTPLKE
jgi:ketosteroid isomerase-like protein